jgi:pimeloyl-ACP methyl ester carboxylesterase
MPDRPPTLVLLHYLGGSARSWDAVIGCLGNRFHCVPIDLTGFGGAAAEVGYTVQSMADTVAARIASLVPTPWFLAGHSMGGKVALGLARRAEDGEPGLANLAGLMLIAASPPEPEPMQESRRKDMLGWFTGSDAERHRHACAYIKTTSAAPLPPAALGQGIADALRMNPAAWRAWLESGSREDWSGRVGVLKTPTLIIAGAEDADLGPDAQAALTARHCASPRIVTLEGAGHLLPMERPRDVAALLAGHAGPIPPAYRALIDSDRVSARTRAALLERAGLDDPGYQPAALASHWTTMRALIARVVPQSPSFPAGSFPIDLAARIDARLAFGAGDGWRFAALPRDREAWRAGLATLDAAAHAQHGDGFSQLPPEAQDHMLAQIAEGSLPLPLAALLLDQDQMRLWFADVRGEAARTFVAHPATLARMGYSGIAYGGDLPRKSGFRAIGAGQVEAWEPAP